MTNNIDIEIPQLNFNEEGELIITASPTSSNHDFDFYEGKWKLHNNSTEGILQPPVVGSFENNRGQFFTKDIFKEKKIVVAFRWDVSDKENPVWSQAFSADNGKTWEWNWYMYFSRIR